MQKQEAATEADDSSQPDQHVELSESDFKDLLVATIPHLRAFGYSLCGRMDLADDLAQDAMLKAWKARKRFRAGTSMKAWTFVILRNGYISQMRRNKFSAPYDELAAERTLAAPAEQQASLHLGDVHTALMQLNQDQREAIILVGAGGFSYEEAADICGCAVGTMKSRVSRARASLADILADEEGGVIGQSERPDGAMDKIMATMKQLAGAQMALAA